MCLCEQIIAKNELDVIDASLTPSNALKKGYQHIEDIPNLYQTLLELLEFANTQGYKIGSPKKTSKHYFGLYCSKQK